MAHTPPRWLRDVLTHDDLEAIARSVAEAEARTSGEIRVHLEPRVPRKHFGRSLTPLARAREVFASLGMHKTDEHHGVLIYIALRDRKLAIFGDEGIHTRVADDYWERLRDGMIEHLKREAPRDAIVHAVRDLGTTLARHFPRRPDDHEERPDPLSVR
jgi:uncharacterized membrane protein